MGLKANVKNGVLEIELKEVRLSASKANNPQPMGRKLAKHIRSGKDVLVAGANFIYSEDGDHMVDIPIDLRGLRDNGIHTIIMKRPKVVPLKLNKDYTDKAKSIMRKNQHQTI